MTNDIEMTKRAMYEYFSILRKNAGRPNLGAIAESAIEAHLEALRQDRGRLVEERDALRNRVQVLESANKIAGERLRVVTEAQEQLGAISAHEAQQKASCAPLDAKTATILGAVVDVQRIVTDWATKGLKAKEAMRLIAGVVNGEPAYSAMLEFERPDDNGGITLRRWKEIDELEKRQAEINKKAEEQKRSHQEREAYLNGSVMKVALAQNALLWSIYHADEPEKGCQHEFHPKFPAGEMCTYCGVAK